jgi:hypothetical protein
MTTGEIQTLLPSMSGHGSESEFFMRSCQKLVSPTMREVVTVHSLCLLLPLCCQLLVFSVRVPFRMFLVYIGAPLGVFGIQSHLSIRLTSDIGEISEGMAGMQNRPIHVAAFLFLPGLTGATFSFERLDLALKKLDFLDFCVGFCSLCLGSLRPERYSALLYE